MSIAKMSSYNYEEENFVRETLAGVLKFPVSSQVLVVGFFQCIHLILHTSIFSPFIKLLIYM